MNRAPACRPTLPAVGAILLAFGCSPAPEASEEPGGAVTIRDSCGEPWSIRTTLETRIGGADDPGALEGVPSWIGRDSLGRVWIAFTAPPIQLRDANGALLAEVGREGQGPGEFRGIREGSVGAGDTVHVFDRSNQRLTMLSGDLEVIREVPLEVRPWGGIVRLESGTWVMNDIQTGPGREGYPLHAVDPEGRLRGSFGAEVPTAGTGFQLGSARSLAAAPGDRVWAAHRTQYRLELWDTENGLHRTLVRRVDWFEPRYESERLPPRTPPGPTLTGIHLGADGTLWTRTGLPRDDYQDFLEEVEPGVWYPREPVNDAFRVRVEAIDPERACVLATLETDADFRGFLDDGGYWTYREAAGDWVPQVELHRIELVRAGG